MLTQHEEEVGAHWSTPSARGAGRTPADLAPAHIRNPRDAPGDVARAAILKTVVAAGFPRRPGFQPKTLRGHGYDE